MDDFRENRRQWLRMIGLEEGQDYRVCEDLYNTISLFTPDGGESRLFVALSYGSGPKGQPALSPKTYNRHVKKAGTHPDDQESTTGWETRSGDSGYILLFDWYKFRQLCALFSGMDADPAAMIQEHREKWEKEKLWGLIRWETFLEGAEKKFYFPNADREEQVMPCVKDFFSAEGYPSIHRSIPELWDEYRAYAPEFYTGDEMRNELSARIGLKRMCISGKDWQTVRLPFRLIYGEERFSRGDQTEYYLEKAPLLKSPWNLGLHYEGRTIKSSGYVGIMPMDGKWKKNGDGAVIPVLRIEPRCSADPLKLLRYIQENNASETEGLIGDYSLEELYPDVWKTKPEEVLFGRVINIGSLTPLDWADLSQDTMPYFVNMNLLFELYCRTLLREALKDEGREWRLEQKKKIKKRLFIPAGAEAPCFMREYEPDMTIMDEDGNAVAVLDAKNSPLQNEEKLRDYTHQVGFYMMALGCNIGGLIGWTTGKSADPVLHTVLRNDREESEPYAELVSLLLEGGADSEGHLAAMKKLIRVLRETAETHHKKT